MHVEKPFVIVKGYLKKRITKETDAMQTGGGKMPARSVLVGMPILGPYI